VTVKCRDDGGLLRWMVLAGAGTMLWCLFRCCCGANVVVAPLLVCAHVMMEAHMSGEDGGEALLICSSCIAAISVDDDDIVAVGEVRELQ